MKLQLQAHLQLHCTQLQLHTLWHSCTATHTATTSHFHEPWIPARRLLGLSSNSSSPSMSFESFDDADGHRHHRADDRCLHDPLGSDDAPGASSEPPGGMTQVPEKPQLVTQRQKPRYLHGVARQFHHDWSPEHRASVDASEASFSQDGVVVNG